MAICAHCEVTIVDPTTEVVHGALTFCCTNCAEAMEHVAGGSDPRPLSRRNVVAGSVRGGMLGHIRWTEHGGLAVLDVPSESTYTLALVDARAITDRQERARLERALAREGVVAFIDPNQYFAIQHDRARVTA